MSSNFFTFDYNKKDGKWNYSRECMPPQLESLDNVTIKHWDRFFIEAKGTVDRSNVRLDLHNRRKNYYESKKLDDGITEEEYLLSQKESSKLQEETIGDWQKLAQSAELIFQQVSVKTFLIPTKKKTSFKADQINDTITTFFGCFGLEFTVYNQNYEKYNGKTVHLFFDQTRHDWSLKRSPMPKELAILNKKYGNEAGKKEVPTEKWFELYDYIEGVKERADRRAEDNDKIDKEITRCKVYYKRADPTNNDLEELHKVKEVNLHNTKKGWKTVQEKTISKWLGPYYSNLLVTPICCPEDQQPFTSPPAAGEAEGQCYGITIHINPGNSAAEGVPPPPSAFTAAPTLPSLNKPENVEEMKVKPMKALAEPED